MEYQFHQSGLSDNSSLNREHKITTQPGIRRIVPYVLYGFLILLLSILLMLIGIKSSQLNKEITDVKLHLERMSRAGRPSSSSSGETTVQKLTAVRGTCRDGWISYQSSCYLLSTTAVPWSIAEEQCQTHSRHLLVLNNVEELDYISGVVEIEYNYWIGLVELQEEGQWSFWDNGQPDNCGQEENGEDCGQLRASKSRIRRMWNDANCVLKYHYICETET
ncbi:asialoglycoprotein receptor-like 1 isoform X2 [Trachinotus anak]|uniref:asialoglycoprotein receptor-like 1 isoform X2 n=1 Tax=Trachinotus anak TaxID=443729 RepID=UPI0039F18FF7